MSSTENGNNTAELPTSTLPSSEDSSGNFIDEVKEFLDTYKRGLSMLGICCVFILACVAVLICCRNLGKKKRASLKRISTSHHQGPCQHCPEQSENKSKVSSSMPHSNNNETIKDVNKILEMNDGFNSNTATPGLQRARSSRGQKKRIYVEPYEEIPEGHVYDKMVDTSTDYQVLTLKRGQQLQDSSLGCKTLDMLGGNHKLDVFKNRRASTLPKSFAYEVCKLPN